MLNDVQSREYNRDKALSRFFGDNMALIGTFQPFADEVADFTGNIALFDSYVPVKDINSTGITTDKRLLKEQVARLGALICSKVHAYADKVGNQSLAGQMNFSGKDILHLKDGDMKSFALNINPAITPLLADAAFIPYQVTATNLADFLSAATAFNALMGSAKATHSTGRVANKDINDVIGLIRNNIRQFDLLIVHFSASNPDFVAGYQINSSIDNIGTRHTRIHGFVTGKSTGNAVPGAVVKVAGTSLQAVTDAAGHYSIPGVTVGDISVSCTANGFAAVEIPFHTRRGRNDELDIQL